MASQVSETGSAVKGSAWVRKRQGRPPGRPLATSRNESLSQSAGLRTPVQRPLFRGPCWPPTRVSRLTQNLRASHCLLGAGAFKGNLRAMPCISAEATTNGGTSLFAARRPVIEPLPGGPTRTSIRRSAQLSLRRTGHEPHPRLELTSLRGRQYLGSAFATTCCALSVIVVVIIRHAYRIIRTLRAVLGHDRDARGMGWIF
jgi:hypothetical protein